MRITPFIFAKNTFPAVSRQTSPEQLLKTALVAIPPTPELLQLSSKPDAFIRPAMVVMCWAWVSVGKREMRRKRR
jgi:hypothetical protein